MRAPLSVTQLTICLSMATLLVVLVPEPWQKGIVAASMLLVCVAFVRSRSLSTKRDQHNMEDRDSVQ